ncbi:SDR family oxidoreductase [Chelativorans sp. M5D2P16]|uniref:SDR family oxidoreductase n=1 Tax=Chelativorans sp. M5D2P16 TaxID=3095678 RepID=UPI002ACA4DA0|nr:SDR family oxidoreductase [Chelativorans sp. M5D2P16]MDZ5698511.1 SDR family oxidoreductase [Chelativorans sp. M5D2P16]
MDFTGKTVIITGAGKGIGRETARLLAGRGARVTALSRTRADLDSLKDEIDCRCVAVDLADAAAARSAAREAAPADYLVNCAGINVLQSFLEVTDEAFDLVHAVNTKAAMIVAQEYARARVEAGGGGAIVNVSSISSMIGFDDHASYCASKGAMDAMSRVMANELGKHSIRVNCINPIVTMTELAARAWSDPAKSEPVLNRIPIGRFAETPDVAEVIAFLLSDAAAMVNGLAIPIDGGFLVR